MASIVSRVKDITGEKFGKLTVVEYSHTEKKVAKLSGNIKYNVYWTCVCKCGNVVTVKKGSLLSGNSRSCGCTRKNRRKRKND